MRIYLIRHAEVASALALDPYMVPLTEVGRAQVVALAEQCLAWDIQFLCVSTTHGAQETADAISRRLSHIERWDVEELEAMNVDDLLSQPTASPRVSAWTPEQLRLGRARAWVRSTAALSRLILYAEASGLDRVALVADETILTMLLLNWLELDWRALDRLAFRHDAAASSLVSLSAGRVEIFWLNRPL